MSEETVAIQMFDLLGGKYYTFRYVGVCREVIRVQRPVDRDHLLLCVGEVTVHIHCW